MDADPKTTGQPRKLAFITQWPCTQCGGDATIAYSARKVADWNGKERARARRDAPVSELVASMRAALQKPAQEIEDALSAHGMGLARATGPEAATSQRLATFAKATGNYVPSYEAGELLIVTGAGHVCRLDERTTGMLPEDRDMHLAALKDLTLPGIAAAKEVMGEASREAFATQKRAEREAARVASKIESMVAECAEAAHDGARIRVDRKGRAVSRTEIECLDRAQVAVVA